MHAKYDVLILIEMCVLFYLSKMIFSVNENAIYALY